MINRFKKYYNVDNDAVIVPDPEENICYSFTLEALLDSNISFTFAKCSGGNSTVTVPGNSSVNICALSVQSPSQPSNKWAIYIGEECQ